MTHVGFLLRSSGYVIKRNFEDAWIKFGQNPRTFDGVSGALTQQQKQSLELMLIDEPIQWDISVEHAVRIWSSILVEIERNP